MVIREWKDTSWILTTGVLAWNKFNLKKSSTAAQPVGVNTDPYLRQVYTKTIFPQKI